MSIDKMLLERSLDEDAIALDDLEAGHEHPTRTSGPRVVVAVDFTSAATAALWQAAVDARDRGGCLLLIHAANGRGASHLLFGAQPTSVDQQAVTFELVSLRLEEIADEVREAFPDLPVAAAVIDGPPAPSVVAFARRVGAERIVVGTAGRLGVTQLVLGSVAAEIVRCAELPVVVVPEGEALPA